MKLLLVEDEPFIALDLEGLVCSAGHQVVGIAETLDGAVSMAQAEQPDAALVDMNLRDGMTGSCIARRLTSELGIRVGFVTGNAEQVPPDFAGAVGVLEKPFTDPGVFELLQLLESLLLTGRRPDQGRFVRLAPA